MIRAEEHFSGWMKKRWVKNEEIENTWLHIIFSGRYILGRPDRKVVMMADAVIIICLIMIAFSNIMVWARLEFICNSIEVIEWLLRILKDRKRMKGESDDWSDI